MAHAEQVRLRYAYDALGQMTGEQTRAGDHVTELRHTYDELGNRSATMLPDGRVLNNLFYGSGHLHQINIDGDVITDIECDKLHRPIQRTQGALTNQFKYDDVGRLLLQVAGHLSVGAGKGAEPVIARRYEYDDAGNLLAIDDQRNGRKTYSYDVIGRIMTAVQPDLAEGFAFDPAHNLVDATVASGGRVEGNRVRVFEDKRYAYDALGNVTEKLIGKHTRLRLEWNAVHQLVKSVATRNAQAPEPTVPIVKYLYDAFERRIAKRDAFGTTRFAWDGNRLLCDACGQWTRTYVYEPGSFVPLAQMETVAGDDTDNSGRPHCTVHHIHADHLGTPNEVTDEHGEIIWASEYKAWGNTQRVVGVAQKRSALALDADCGRYVSLDQIGLAGGSNSDQYAPDPSGWTDPFDLAKAACECNGVGNDTPLTAKQLRNTPGVVTVSRGLSPSSGQWLDPRAQTSSLSQVANALAGK